MISKIKLVIPLSLLVVPTLLCCFTIIFPGFLTFGEVFNIYISRVEKSIRASRWHSTTGVHRSNPVRPANRIRNLTSLMHKCRAKSRCLRRNSDPLYRPQSHPFIDKLRVSEAVHIDVSEESGAQSSFRINFYIYSEKKKKRCCRSPSCTVCTQRHEYYRLKSTTVQPKRTIILQMFG